MQEACQSSESAAPVDDRPDGGAEPGPSSADDESGSSGGEDLAVIDVSRKEWEMALFQRPLPAESAAEVLYVYGNKFHFVPRAVGRYGRLKTLKFFANEVEVLPPEAGDLVELEELLVKVSWPGLSGLPLKKLRSLKALELSREPSRASALSILSEIAGLNRLTKLSICHFSIRYLPPEIGCLKKLEELDLSFNKLKNLPSDIAQLSALKSLRVANNKLTDLPSAISSLRKLEILDVSNNRLTSLTSLDLDSMHTLQHLNLQHNKFLSHGHIPSWICCNLEGNGADMANVEASSSTFEVELYDVGVSRIHGNCSCNGNHTTSSCLHSETSLRCRQGMKKVWKRRDYLQQRARQERLNSSRMRRGEDNNNNITMKMSEENDSCEPAVDEISEFQFDVDEEKISDSSANSSFQLENTPGADEDDAGSSSGDNSSVSHNYIINKKSDDDSSCLTSESANLNNYCESEHIVENHPSACSLDEVSSPDECSSEASKLILKAKRHSDKDLDNPKPSKFRKPINECSRLSYKYSSESFCSIDDHLPDGFYDAGRDRPFMSLQDYERSLCLDSREVILLDRDKDEELDAIALSAQMLLSKLKRSCSSEKEEVVVDNLRRSSILALFVSDCFGGSDRSTSVIRARRAVAGSHKQQPFICTCSNGNVYGSGERYQPTYGVAGSPNFTDMCEQSLRLIKGTLNSNVVPIGTLRFGVCRHRAVLMKYLCDRADPPIPCELVRGYLDFMPHAWNTIHVRRGDTWVRMVVDACYPTDIREETDSEYFCRYVPLSRLHVPLTTESYPVSGLIPSSSLIDENEKWPSCSVNHCKLGTLDAAIKVRNLEAHGASDEEIRSFECTFLGEVRMLDALRKHSCITEIYGHQLSSKWVYRDDGNTDSRLLQSIIIMEYVCGGSLKCYLEKLSKGGEKYVPVDISLSIARDVACALVEVHSKHIIHRDIKSENILIDLDSKRTDGSPIIKLSDFDRSVPLKSFTHTCCIAHLGIHPPDVCVGTPRWMAPEVAQAMHHRNPYGLEVDIWSYGCLLLELLTLQIPYMGHSDAELYDLLQRKQRPRLTPELETLAQSDEPRARPESGSSPGAQSDVLKFLVDLFYECTEADPAKRPTARHIFEKLCSISTQQDSTQVYSSSE